MKKIVIIIILLVFSSCYSFAQQKNSLAIGGDFSIASLPAAWRVHSYELNFEKPLMFYPRIAYYYKNKFAAMAQLTYVDQHATFKNDYQGSEFYLERDIVGVSVFAGYKFMQLSWKQKGYLLNKIDFWIYPGVTYYLHSYTNLGPMEKNRDDFKHIIRPSGMLAIKYNYAKYGFVSLSGGYYYASRYTQPLVFGMGVGFQF